MKWNMPRVNLRRRTRLFRCLELYNIPCCLATQQLVTDNLFTLCRRKHLIGQPRSKARMASNVSTYLSPRPTHERLALTQPS